MSKPLVNPAGPEAPIEMDRWLAAQAEIERLRKALAPFSWYYSVNDCAETDQKVMEVPVSDLRRAFEAHPVTEPPPANQ